MNENLQRTVFEEGDIVSTKENVSPRRCGDAVQVIDNYAMIHGKYGRGIFVQGLPYSDDELVLVKKKAKNQALLAGDWIEIKEGWFEIRAISDRTMLLQPIGGGCTFTHPRAEIIACQRRPGYRAMLEAKNRANEASIVKPLDEKLTLVARLIGPFARFAAWVAQLWNR